MIKDLRPALRTFLLEDDAISSAVGGVRIHGLRLPAGTLAGPSIVYSQISEDTDHHMQGPSGLVSSRYQLDAWATTFDQAHSLALLVKERLDGHRGPMGTGANVIEVRGVFSDNARADYDSAANLHRASRDFFFNYAER